MCSGEGGAVFVVLRRASGGKTFSRWVKLIGSTGGSELFSRQVEDVEPVQAGFFCGEDAEGMLLMLSADGCLRSWCGRFGASSAQWQSEGPITASLSIVPAKSPKRKVDASPPSVSHYCIGGSWSDPTLHCVRAGSSGSTLSRVELIRRASTSLTGLVRAIGCQRDNVGAPAPLVYSLFASPEAGDGELASEVATPASGARGTLGALARPLKRKLQQAAQWRAKYAGAELEQASDAAGEDEAEGDRVHKRERLTADASGSSDSSRAVPAVPLEASTAFLRALHGRVSVDILVSDWDVLLTLLTTHRCVSIQHPNNPDLIDQALSAGRLDVLSCLARYAPDLTEGQAAQLLVQVAVWNVASPVGQRALRCLRVGASGVLAWVPRQEAAAVVAAHSSSASKKGKQKGKVEKSPSAVADTAAEGQLTHLDLVRALSESLLRRTGAFSPTLLADAARMHVPSSAAAMLLQVFLLFLRGLCPGPSAPKSLAFQGFVHDVQVRRAVVWCEALLDAHFCDVALTMGSGSGTSNLQSALQAAGALLPVTGIAAGAVLAEEVMGMWTHVHRTARIAKEKGSQHAGAVLSPPGGLYRLERIVF